MGICICRVIGMCIGVGIGIGLGIGIGGGPCVRIDGGNCIGCANGVVIGCSIHRSRILGIRVIIRIRRITSNSLISHLSLFIIFSAKFRVRLKCNIQYEYKS